jgi:hypothetical protein
MYSRGFLEADLEVTVRAAENPFTGNKSVGGFSPGLRACPPPPSRDFLHVHIIEYRICVYPVLIRQTAARCRAISYGVRYTLGIVNPTYTRD